MNTEALVATSRLPVSLPGESALWAQLEVARRMLWEADSDEEIRHWCRWSMTLLVAAAESLETRLSPEELRQRFDHWDLTVRRARNLSEYPTAQLGPILILLKRLGRFLARQSVCVSERTIAHA